MKEKNKNLVKVDDVKYEVLAELFRFIYTGKVGNIEEILCELLAAAEKYCVEDLKELCEEKMTDNVTNDNAVDYLNFAIMHNAEKLKSAVIYHISLFIDHFIEHTEFDKIAEQHPKMLIKIIKNLRRL